MAFLGEIEPVYSEDERGLASRIAYEWGHSLAWSEEIGKWIVRREGESIWRADVLVERTSKALESAERHAEYADQPRFLRLSSQKEALEFAKPLLAVELSQFDINPWALNTPSGLINLRSGEYVPNHLIRGKYMKCCAVSPESMPTPLWDRHLQMMCKGDIEIIAFLKRLAGITLIGDQNQKPHIAPQFNGLGRNGKGVFLQGLGWALGDYAQFASTRLLTTTENAHTTEQAGLRGMRMVVVEEVKRINSSVLKDLTGGGTIRARHMYKDDIEFLKSWTLWFNNNGPMSFSGDQSDGLWQRVQRIDFGEGIPVNQRIYDMAEQIKGEAPGILRWMLDGLREFLELGDLAITQSVLENSDISRADADPLSAFLQERYERVEGEKVLGSDLVRNFSYWCKEREERSGGLRFVYDSLRSRFGLKVRPGAKNKTFVFVLKQKEVSMSDIAGNFFN